MNEEYQKPIDYITFINAKNETTIIDIFNKLPKMSLEHINSIRPIDENVNLTFEVGSNNPVYGFQTG